MIYFDIDGCIRDLSTAALGYEPSDWWEKKDGKTIPQLIAENPRVLTVAKPTEYHSVISTWRELHIISCQPLEWRKRTDEWLRRYFPLTSLWTVYVDRPEDKLRLLSKGDYIVEDYPFFKDYSKVILIDRAYNRNAAARVRVRTPGELREVLRHGR